MNCFGVLGFKVHAFGVFVFSFFHVADLAMPVRNPWFYSQCWILVSSGSNWSFYFSSVGKLGV